MTLDFFAAKHGEKDVTVLKSGEAGEIVIVVNKTAQTWTMFYAQGPNLCGLFLGKGIKGALLTKFIPI